MNKYSDKELIQMLKSESSKTVDIGLEHLYQVSKQTVAGFILRNKGNQQDVSDIFHDGLIAFYNLVRQDKINTDTNVEAYLYTICRNMWAKHLKKGKRTEELTDTHTQIPVEATQVTTIIEGEQKELLDTILKQVGADCRKLLILFYFHRLRMKSIVEQMALSNEQVVRNKKASCMKKLRSIVLDSPVYKDLLLKFRE